MRGDNLFRESEGVAGNGSPPHAWGQRLVAPFPRPAVRFTPTCVGTTAPRWPRTLPPSVHPHMRGDNTNFWYLFDHFPQNTVEVIIGVRKSLFGCQRPSKQLLLRYLGSIRYSNQRNSLEIHHVPRWEPMNSVAVSLGISVTPDLYCRPKPSIVSRHLPKFLPHSRARIAEKHSRFGLYQPT